MRNTSNEGKVLVFTGAYAESHETGICVYAFHPESGDLELLDQQAGIKNPTFLNVDPKRRLLYAIGETEQDGQKRGEVVTFAIDVDAGTLKLLSRSNFSGSSTCHIQRDEKGQYLLLSSYHGGFVDLVSLDENGIPSQLLEEYSHTAFQATENDKPKAHSVFFSPDEQYIMAQDLGLDKIMVSQIDAEAGKLSNRHVVDLKQGAGPRHLAFHPDGQYAYVINELNSTITTFSYKAATGELTEQQTVSTLPAGFEGENGCAEIAVSKDGRTLYGSNRGHDSLAVYRIHPENGKLELLQHISTEGGHPRHFCMLPGESFLTVANRDGNNLVMYQVNQEDGTLTYTGKTVAQSKPVCVKPAVFE
ncbi:lactonase family protein [Paenibacillus sp. JSM ZJ436]|uniref:lactonase family protein n=1 Tax=Paenibacillus sp. JSM ZJ436 TaxID=3376190 RepID=UPI003799D734